MNEVDEMLPRFTLLAEESASRSCAFAELIPEGLDVLISPSPSPWDCIQNGATLRAGQSDCNWLAWEACDTADGTRFAGLVALHRTGPRLVGVGGPAGTILGGLIPRPQVDARPLLLSVLYDLDGSSRPADCWERPLDGSLDPARFSFVSSDRRQAFLVTSAAALRERLPEALRALFAYDGPALAIRTCTPRFELELFLRPLKNAVSYGDPRDASIRCGATTIHYVQRPRLAAIGLLRRRGYRTPWGPWTLLRGDATQDRHWMTISDPRLRWHWLMARLDDGRECMAFQMRTADGGRDAPMDAGRPVGGGAWIVERDGRTRQAMRWALTPEKHERTPRGAVPTQTRLHLPDEGLHLVLAHDRPTFVPTRALSEIADAGIWETPASLVDGAGISGGRFWIDVMPPWAGA